MPLRPSRWPVRQLALFVVVVTALGLGGCAMLPPDAQRTALHAPSTSLPPVPGSRLARMAEGAPPDATLSGFRLMVAGEPALHTRLEIIRRAAHTLDVQSYHIQNDETGRFFLRSLRDAAERGVRVRLLLDDLYTAGHDDLLLGLAGHRNVELRLFNPFPAARGSLVGRFAAALFDFGRVHRRMHNKLLIGDGVVAVAGGRNIANDYFMRQPGDNFIDLDTFVTGAVLPRLAVLFDSYWNSSHAWPIEVLAHSRLDVDSLRAFFERATAADSTPDPGPPAPVDDPLDQPVFDDFDSGRLRLIWARADAFADQPDKILGDELPSSAEPPRDRLGIRHNLVEHIRQARHEVLVSTPYLVPTRRSLDTVALLRERGVRMAVLTNSLAATDEPVVHSAYRRYRGDLLRADVALYELSPLRAPRTLRMARLGQSVGRLHAKAAVIDREIFYIGSFNFDHRSATHNTELGLIVHSPELAARAAQLFQDLSDDAAYRLRIGPDGALQWLAKAEDGSEELRVEPDAGWWRRLVLELLGPFVPEDLL